MTPSVEKTKLVGKYTCIVNARPILPQNRIKRSTYKEKDVRVREAAIVQIRAKPHDTTENLGNSFARLKTVRSNLVVVKWQKDQTFY